MILQVKNDQLMPISIIYVLGKTTTLPLQTKQTYSKENLFSNNNEIKSETPFITSQQCSQSSVKTSPSIEPLYRHKPGCPKYIPSSEHNLLSSDLFTHTTIDNIKKMFVYIIMN